MASRYNVLLLGDVERAADELSDGDATQAEIQAALTNALRAIKRLEEEVEALRHQVPDNR